VKFGLMLGGLSPRHYIAASQHAERLGFDSVWIPEHVVMPVDMPAEYPYTTSGLPPITTATPLYDPWSVLSFVAAATSSVMLGTNVYVLPLRHPLLTARAAVTVDRLSGGRLLLGIGVGWLAAEFDALGVPFAERGVRTDETIQVLRRLWSDEVVQHDGHAYAFDPVRFEPKPRSRPSIPILVGGSSPAALRRAGRLGDGWIEIGTAPDTIAPHLRQLIDHRREAGREHLPFEVTASPHGELTVAAVEELEDLGVSRIMVSSPLVRPDEMQLLEWLEEVAQRVIAAGT
jgi:probable F420-dependent oxidoreductase